MMENQEDCDKMRLTLKEQQQQIEELKKLLNSA